MAALTFSADQNSLTYNGEQYSAINATDDPCYGCEFGTDGQCSFPYYLSPGCNANCGISGRKDKRSIIWIKSSRITTSYDPVIAESIARLGHEKLIAILTALNQ